LLGTMLVATPKGARDEAELSVAWEPAGAAITGLVPRLGVAPATGDFVVVVGHPGLYDGLSLEHQYTTGTVTATNLQATLASVPMLVGTETEWASGWSTDAVAWHGNSGGPVFNAQGEWMGVLVGTFNGAADNLGPDLSVVLPVY
jgi:S1-C subfamily serine protease